MHGWTLDSGTYAPRAMSRYVCSRKAWVETWVFWYDFDDNIFEGSIAIKVPVCNDRVQAKLFDPT